MTQHEKEALEERASELIGKNRGIVKAMMDELLAQAECYQLFMVNALDEIDLNKAMFNQMDTTDFVMDRRNLRTAIEAMTLNKLLIQYVALKKLYECLPQEEEKPANYRKCDACDLMKDDVIDFIPMTGVDPYKLCSKCADKLYHNSENIARGLRDTGHTEEEIHKRLAKITRDFVHQPPLEEEKNNG